MTEANIGLKGIGLSGFAEELLDAIGIGETLKYTVKWTQLEIFDRLLGNLWFRDLFSIFENPQHLYPIANPKALPYHPYHIARIFYEVARKSLEASMVMGEEIGSEGIMEMLSEGLSSALETNYNASLQTILNVWKGSLPPDLSVAYQLGTRLDYTDINYSLSMLAPTSALPYTILEALIHSANQRLYQLLANIDSLYIQLIGERLSIALAMANYYLSYAELVAKSLIGSIFEGFEALENWYKSSLEQALSSLTALEDDLEAYKKLNETEIDGEKLLPDQTYEENLASINAQVDGLMDFINDLDSYYSDILADLINNYTSKINSYVNTAIAWFKKAEELLDTLITVIANHTNTIDVDSQLKTKIAEIYEGLRAYRQCGFDYETA